MSKSGNHTSLWDIVVGTSTEAPRKTPRKQRVVSGGIKELADSLCGQIAKLALAEKVEALNEVKRMLHEISPFSGEPVDCVTWVPIDQVQANDYNPNSVAPPEMDLLRVSIMEDGYTQPIVGWGKNGHIEVVDGFHRNRIGKESNDVRKRIHGYLPVAQINSTRGDRGDRIAATIRHNRARGKHKVEAMSDIVIELKRRNWSDEKIAKQLGMDADEVLRLCQITGLAEMFADSDFSEAWETGDGDDEEFSLEEGGAEGVLE